MSATHVRSNTPILGKFHASVSGAVQCALDGDAVFGIEPNQAGKDILALVLRVTPMQGGEYTILCSNSRSDVPSPREFGFGDMGSSTFVGLFSHTTPDGKTGSFVAGPGTLQLTDSGPLHIRGTLEFHGTGNHNYQLWAVDGEVRVSAQFNAVKIADPFGYAFPKD